MSFSALRQASTLSLSLLAAVFASGCSKSPEERTTENAKTPSDTVITVYTERKEHLLKPLFDAYTQKTGIAIRYTTDAAGPLVARLASEGETTPADLFITVDAGNLWQAAEQGLLRPLNSPLLEANVPSQWQDTQNRWFGLSLRARTIVYATDRVQPAELSTYEDLADPRWKGRLCLRSAKKVYNQSLVAMMIETLGADKTESLVKGWVANLATEPYSNDTLLMEDMAAGRCDVGLVNSYYFGRLQLDKPGLPLALFWANQQDRGLHVNISGAGVTQHAKHPEAAQALLEWLSSQEAQYTFADLNQEYPVNPAVEASNLVKNWGTFKADATPIEVAGKRQAEAVMLMDRAGYF